MDQDRQNAGRAAVFSFLFNGLGHIYLGKIAKGLFLMSLSTLCMIVLIIGAVILAIGLLNNVIISGFNLLGLALFLFGLLGLGIVGIYSIFDAYNISSEL